MTLKDRIQEQCKQMAGEAYTKKRYLLAVSGGIDSMVLLEVFSQLFPAPQLIVAHVDHGVRSFSHRDLNFVRKVAKKYRLQFVSTRLSGCAHSEEQMRQHRLAFLERQQRILGCDFVVTAHHAKDQLETILMRLIRGTGLKGLAGIPNCRKPWLRPLLLVHPTEIDNYAAVNQIAFREDETNHSPKYFRNRIRHELLPSIENLSGEFGGEEALYERVAMMSKEATEVSHYLESQSESLYHSCVTESPYWFRLSYADWKSFPEILKSFVLRRIIKRLGLNVLSRNAVNQTINNLESGVSQFYVEEGLRVQLSCGQLYFQRRDKVIAALDFVREGTSIYSKELSMKLNLSENLSPQVYCRTFEPGDRMGSHKLKELFLRSRLPRPERSLVPLLVEQSTQNVVWYPASSHPEVVVERLQFPFVFDVAR